MIDIHAHILPGLDDGAEDRAIALRTILRARDEDITAIFMTPHSDSFDLKPGLFQTLFESMREELGQFLAIYPGCEVNCDPCRMDQICKALEERRYPTMNGTKYVLIEFSDLIMPEDALRCVQALTKEDWKPVIAHMERYRYLRGRMKLVDALLEEGALIQVNTYSLSEMDEMDSHVRNWAQQLILERKIAFLGTDTHGIIRRSPSARRGLSWLYDACKEDTDYADAIAFGNAQRLLIDGN